MRVILAALLGLLLLIGAGADLRLAHAQVEAPATKSVVIDKRKLLVKPRNADGTEFATPFLEDPVAWMREKQQGYYSRISTSLRQLRAQPSVSAGWALFLLSFLYGLFHAAGPGHGKAVISGWLLATENELRRGILIAFISAMIQAATAIVVVSALLLLVSGASLMAKDAAEFLESASYVLIALMGLYLVWTAWRGHGLGHGHGHGHGQGPEVAAPVVRPVQVERRHEGMMFELVSRPAALAAGGAAVVGDHLHHENCGCGHVPAAADVRGDWSLARAFALAFAVGIRPCSGAILVLIFAWPLGLYWAGIASVLAMGVGVFLTISAIAVATVFAKGLALRFVAADTPLMGLAVKWAKTVIGLAIAGFGLLLFLGSIGSGNLSM